MTDEEFLQQARGPMRPAVPGMSDEEFLRQATGPSGSVVEPGQPASSGGIWPTLEHIAREGALGLQQSLQLNPFVALNQLGREMTGREPAKPAFLPGEPPNAFARYGGAVAHALMENPLISGAFPLQTLGGAVGGEAAAQLGGPQREWWMRPIGGLLGGIGGGLGESIVKGVTGANKIENITKGMGTATDIEEGAQKLWQSAKNWIGDGLAPGEKSGLNKAEAPYYRTLDAAIPGEDLVNMDTINRTFKSLMAPGEATASAVAPIYKRLVDATSPTMTPAKLPPGLRSMNAPEEKIGNLTWQQARDWRSLIGSQLNDPAIRALPDKARDAIYGAFTRALEGKAAEYGLADEFKTANAVSERLRKDVETIIGPVAQSPTAGRAAQRALEGSGGKYGTGERLDILKNVFPDEVSELARAHILQNPRDWVRGLSERARESLVPDAAMRERIDNAIREMGNVKLTGGSLTGSLTGFFLGEKFVPYAQQGLEFLGKQISPDTASFIAPLVGALTPAIIGGGAAVARNPLWLRHPAIGISAAPDTSLGGNALSLPSR